MVLTPDTSTSSSEGRRGRGGGPQEFPGQVRDVIPPPLSWVGRGVSSRWDVSGSPLIWRCSRRRPDQTPEPPQLIAPDAEEQQVLFRPPPGCPGSSPHL